MAKKKIREYSAKRLLKKAMKEHLNKDVKIECLQINPATQFDEVAAENPWVKEKKLVVKPDMLFGQRGKTGMVKLNCTWDEAVAFLKEKRGSEHTIKKLTGHLTHFLVEPFVPHDESKECYMSILTKRTGCVINFSARGGISVEENWEASMRSITVGPLDSIDNVDIEGKLTYEMGEKGTKPVADFLRDCFRVFATYDYAYLEMNPFFFSEEECICYALDMRTELDDCGRYRQEIWKDVEFPEPFGMSHLPEEEYISSLDEKTGASLKLTILNPKGRIWTMVAGGGASVIYADTVADLGMGHELGNYGEYSGAPNEEETYCYAKTLFDLATRNPDKQRRALICGGGIANFTDVAVTFKGIIRAIREFREKFVAANVQIFVRRGGPNYKQGLEMMRNLGKEIDLPIDVYGPETSMTYPVPLAIKYVKGE